MRKLDIGDHRFTEVEVMDEPGDGGACHEYTISSIGNGVALQIIFGQIKFQKGPVQEAGPNGCFQEDLIAICIDRLRSFQAGEFACHENAQALASLEHALTWLNERTKDRQNRGAEGTNKQ